MYCKSLKKVPSYIYFKDFIFHLYIFTNGNSFDMKKLFATSEKEGYFPPDCKYIPTVWKQV